MKRFFLLFAVLFLSGQLFSQLRFDYPVKNIEPVQIIATYSLKYQEDSTNPNFIRNEDMFLFLGKKVSYFIGSNQYVIDTLMRKVKDIQDFQLMLSNPDLPIARLRYRIYKNYPEGKITYIEHIPSNTFKYEEDLNLFQWKLTQDTATVAGYKAQKATCNFGGRSWIAWFTPEIPYSDGPYKFNGLPGLIVKIADTRNHYVFELESLQKPQPPVMIDFVEKDFVELSKKQFFKAKDNFHNDIVNRAKDAGFNSKESEAIYRKYLSRNNPIELKRN